MNDQSYDVYNTIYDESEKFFKGFKSEYADSGMQLKEAIELFMKSGLEEKIYNALQKASKGMPAKYGAIEDTVLKELTDRACIKLNKYFEDELKKIKVVDPNSKVKKENESTVPVYTKFLG